MTQLTKRTEETLIKELELIPEIQAKLNNLASRVTHHQVIVKDLQTSLNNVQRERELAYNLASVDYRVQVPPIYPKDPKNKLWSVAIVDPNEDRTRSTDQIVLLLDNETMATSGNYRKFRITSAGKKVVHTVNPKTGFASASNLLSVSVIANLE